MQGVRKEIQIQRHLVCQECINGQDKSTWCQSTHWVPAISWPVRGAFQQESQGLSHMRKREQVSERMGALRRKGVECPLGWTSSALPKAVT